MVFNVLYNQASTCLSLSIYIYQPQWLPLNAVNTPSPFTPQGLCMSCFPVLKMFFPQFCIDNILSFFRVQLKYNLFRTAFPPHSAYSSCMPPLLFSTSDSCFFYSYILTTLLF